MEHINKSKNNFMTVFTKHDDVSFKIDDVETVMSSYKGNELETFTVCFESGYFLKFHADDFEDKDNGLLDIRDALRSYIKDREDWVEK